MKSGMFKKYVQLDELACVLEWLQPGQRDSVVRKVLCITTLNKLLNHYEPKAIGTDLMSLEDVRNRILGAIDRKKAEQSKAIEESFGKENR